MNFSIQFNQKTCLVGCFIHCWLLLKSLLQNLDIHGWVSSTVPSSSIAALVGEAVSRALFIRVALYSSPRASPKPIVSTVTFPTCGVGVLSEVGLSGVLFEFQTSKYIQLYIPLGGAVAITHPPE